MSDFAAKLPYPDLNCIRPDPAAARAIAPAYAANGSELSAILQYIYHHFRFDKLGMDDYAKELEHIAEVEMRHLDILGTLLIKLGSDPVYTQCPPHRCNFFCASEIAYSDTPMRMLSDDFAGEVQAVCKYRQILSCLNNKAVAAVIERIILDEEIHIKILTEMIANLNKPHCCKAEEAVAPMTAPNENNEGM